MQTIRMGTKRYELTDSEWNQIKDMLPPEHPKEGKRGRPAQCDNRSAMNGILWIARGGAPWRELPERYGPWQTVYSRFRKWRDMGMFEAVFQALSVDADFENISIDSTSCKVHQSADGGKNQKIRQLVYPEAAEIRRSILWWMALAIRWLFCSAPAMTTTLYMLSSCSAR